MDATKRRVTTLVALLSFLALPPDPPAAASYQDAASSPDTTSSPPVASPPDTARANAVTFHGIKFRCESGGWKNDVVLDSATVAFVSRSKERSPLKARYTGVGAIYYGDACIRHGDECDPLGVFALPGMIKGLFHKTRTHRVAIPLRDTEGKRNLAVLEVRQEQVRQLLSLLSARTGRPIVADSTDGERLKALGVEAVPDTTAFHWDDVGRSP
jgi:hypothetical protein